MLSIKLSCVVLLSAICVLFLFKPYGYAAKAGQASKKPMEAVVTDNARLITYPVPDAAKDSPYTVEVNGKLIPIEKAGAIAGCYYARFQFDKPVRATVKVTSSKQTDFSLKPERFANGLKYKSSDMSFDVCEPGPRIITTQADGKPLWPLFIIAENHAPLALPAKSGIIDVKSYGVTSEGVQTERIQKALDDCAAKPGGGMVYFAPGIYHTGTIRIKDNTTVYLAPGALIVASTDPKDFPVDAGRIETGTHGPVCSFSRLIIFDHCKNSELIGHGAIDGMGHILRNQHKRHIQLLDITASSNIKVENVVLRNSAEWTVHILGCDNVYIDNLKIFNDFQVSNTDGIDPDGSTNVHISHYYAHCGDDAIAIKTTGNLDILKPARNIEIKDSIVMCRKTSFKVGTETYEDISDVLFDNCEAVNSSRGMALWQRDGHTISNVAFRNIKLDLVEIPDEGMSGEPIRVDISERHGIGAIKNVTFDRITSHAPYTCPINGMPQSKLEGFKFWGCHFYVNPRTDKMGKKPVLNISNARDFVFKYTTLTWPNESDKDTNWTEFIEQKDSENILVQPLTEVFMVGM